MNSATLTRFLMAPDRSVGRFTYEDIFSAYSIENPWLDNTPWTSCIPCGEYIVVRKASPKYGPKMWLVQGVEGRSDILFHVANWAKDVSGCIGLGTEVWPNLSGVAQSGRAIREFYAVTDKIKKFSLTIKEGVICH